MQSRQSTRLWAAAVALTFPLAFTTACSRNDLSTQGDSPSQAEHGTGATNQPSQGDARVSNDARALAVTLTGCVEQQPGAIVLTALETAGAGRATASGGSHAGQSSTSSAATSDSGASTLPSDSPGSGHAYRLEAAGDEDLSQYVGQRVTVVGRLASNVPSEATKSPADNDRAAVPGTGPNFGERTKAGRGAPRGDDVKDRYMAGSQQAQQGQGGQRGESAQQGKPATPPRVNAIDTRLPDAPQALWVNSVRKVADTCGAGE